MKSRLTPIARGLRRRMTEAERHLWKILRGKQLEGLKFRRQQPIRPIIVDFVCFRKKLVIEADGSQHHEGRQKLIDIERDKWLHGQGFEFLRFGNNEIMENTEGVTLEIMKYAAGRPDQSVGSSPSMGGLRWGWLPVMFTLGVQNENQFLQSTR